MNSAETGRSIRDEIADLLSKASRGDQEALNELLRAADDAINSLAIMAKKRPKYCERLAASRLAWPGYVSNLPSLEAKSQALKAQLPIGRDWGHLHCKTATDLPFRVALNAVQYFSDRVMEDSLCAFYFVRSYPGIEGIGNKRAREIWRSIGKPVRSNWAKWKPIFEDYLTLNYGPTGDRWRLIPSTGNAPWNQNFSLCARFGVADLCALEYLRHNQVSKEERAHIRSRAAKMNRSLLDLMSVQHDASLARTSKLARDRNAKWSAYKNQLLQRCKNLLPVN